MYFVGKVKYTTGSKQHHPLIRITQTENRSMKIVSVQECLRVFAQSFNGIFEKDFL